MSHDIRGLQTLAILYALPYALLMWSYVMSSSDLFLAVLSHILGNSTLSFLLAFMFACFIYSSVVTRSLVGAFLVAVTIFIIWCIITAWTPEFSQMNFKIWATNTWETAKEAVLSRARALTPKKESQEQRHLSETPTFCGDSPTNEKQVGKRQGSWAIKFFVRKPTAGSPVPLDSDGQEMVEV
jgi:uncharacterized membrane protein